MLVDFSAARSGHRNPRSTSTWPSSWSPAPCSSARSARFARPSAAGWGDTIARVLPYLQRAALTPHLRDLARSHEVGLKELRERAAAATGTPKPELAPLRRVRPRDVLLMALVIFAAYLLVSQLAEIGFGTIAGELGNADLAWVIVALILAQCTFIGSGISVRGAVATPLALLPCIVLQSAIKFINLTVPSSAGRIGMNLRFLQRMGAQPGEALPPAPSTTRPRPLSRRACSSSRSRSSAPTSTRANSRERDRIAACSQASPSASSSASSSSSRCRRCAPGSSRRSGRALSNLWDVARIRRKRVELFGGNILSELLYAVSLGASVPRVRRQPQPRPADLHQHLGVGAVQHDPGARRYRRRRGRSVGRSHLDGRGQVDGVRDRAHTASVHVLPASDLGLFLVALVDEEGLPLNRAECGAGSVATARLTDTAASIAKAIGDFSDAAPAPSSEH